MGGAEVSRDAKQASEGGPALPEGVDGACWDNAGRSGGDEPAKDLSTWRQQVVAPGGGSEVVGGEEEDELREEGSHSEGRGR